MSQEFDSSRREFIRNVALGGAGFLALTGGLSAGVIWLGDRISESMISEQQKKLSSLGMLGDLQLIDIRTIPGFNVSGGFAFGSGNFNGETKSSIQFAWKTKQENPEVIISEIPVDKVIFNVISGQQDVPPHVDFNFVATGDTKSNNPNDYVGKASTAVFTLSEDDFANFRGNQQAPQQ